MPRSRPSKPKHRGVREDGTNDAESLTVRGWQHAGALAAVFAGPGAHPVEAHLERPDFIFAAGVGKKRVKIERQDGDRRQPQPAAAPDRDADGGAARADAR